MDEMLKRVCKENDTNPFMVFLFANEYKEMRLSLKQVSSIFEKHCKLMVYQVGKKEWIGFTVIDSMPEFVENFCLDVLAKRTYVPKIGQKHKEKIKEYEETRKFLY